MNIAEYFFVLKWNMLNKYLIIYCTLVMPLTIYDGERGLSFFLTLYIMVTSGGSVVEAWNHWIIFLAHWVGEPQCYTSLEW